MCVCVSVSQVESGGGLVEGPAHVLPAGEYVRAAEQGHRPAARHLDRGPGQRRRRPVIPVAPVGRRASHLRRHRHGALRGAPPAAQGPRHLDGIRPTLLVIT